MSREVSQMSNLPSVQQTQVWMCAEEFPRKLEKVWEWPLGEPWVFKAIIAHSASGQMTWVGCSVLGMKCR